MIFEPFYIVLAKRIAVALIIAGAYLWVSTDEYEFEQQQQQIVPPELPTVSEPEPELATYDEPTQLGQGWMVPPEPVRKTVAKVKRKIKRTVEKR